MPAETAIFAVFLIKFDIKTKKRHFPKQIVSTKMPFLPPAEHKSCFAILLKTAIFDKICFLFPPTPKTRFFWVFFAICFCFFLLFLFVFLQHKKEKCQFLFRNLIFDILAILQQHYFGTPYTLSVKLSIPKKHDKIGETSKKSWTRYWLLTWTTYRPKTFKCWTR